MTAMPPTGPADADPAGRHPDPTLPEPTFADPAFPEPSAAAVSDDQSDPGAGDPLAALGGLFGPGGLGSMQDLLAQAQQMQAELADAQRQLADTEVSGTAGGGLVQATVTGDRELVGLRIDPSVIDPDDPETLADLVVAAVRAANEQARGIGEQAMAQSMPDLSSLGGLGGLGTLGGSDGDPDDGDPDEDERDPQREVDERDV